MENVDQVFSKELKKLYKRWNKKYPEHYIEVPTNKILQVHTVTSNRGIEGVEDDIIIQGQIHITEITMRLTVNNITELWAQVEYSRQ